ncbi:hypothetical protein HYC85_022423, partial [Camellia sinensis]
GYCQACSQIGAAGSHPVLNKVSEFKDAFWRFLRPHTIRGTTLGSISLVARALIENTNLIRWSLLFKAFSGLLALLCGNGYIVGINQIYDIGIDNVTGLLIVGINFGPFITALYCLGLFLGTIYSVPPFRMKRFPVVAFLIIAMVQGFLLNFGVYYATRAALGLTFEWRKGVKWTVGNGNNVNVWKDWWCGDKAFMDLESNTNQNLHNNCNIDNNVSELLNSDGSWNEIKVHSLCTPNIAFLILNNPPPGILEMDSPLWKGSPAGSFTVSSVYNLILGETENEEDWNWLWRM